MTTEETFCQFLLALQETGARPGEIQQVTAENVNLAHGVWVLSKHKTAKKTKRPRVIYLTSTMVELTIALYFVLFRKDLNQRLLELWSRLPTWCRKLT